MASASYTFTHLNGFQTRVDLQDAATGVVNWQAYFIRTNFAWTSFNLNVAGNSNAPRMEIALGGATLGGGLVYYTYDFRGSASQYTIGSGSISVTPGATLSLTGYNDPKGSMGIANASGTFTTAPWPTPVWSTGTSLTAAVRNRSVSRTVSASPVTSYSLVSSSGATGLSVSTSGVISGTPTVFGTASLTIRASNNGSTADRTFTMVIQSTPPKVWTTSFVDGLLQVWNGSSWVRGRIRVWNGSAWVDSK